MKTILIHRHPDCARCERIARRHHSFDWLDRIADTTADPPGRRAVDKGEIVVQELKTGVLLEGDAAVSAILRQVPLYWPLLPFVLCSSWLQSLARAGTRAGSPRTKASAPGGRDA